MKYSPVITRCKTRGGALGLLTIAIHVTALEIYSSIVVQYQLNSSVTGVRCCSADHVQDWQPYPVDPYLCYICDHT